jgi:hypothetical protein
LLAALCVFAGSGCHSTYNQTFANPRPDIAPLRASTRVYISMPEDAIDKKDPVPASGRRTTIALEGAFKRQTRGVYTAKLPETMSEALTRARERECEFLAFPTILKWQDRPTEWTGVRDKLQLKVDLILVATGDIVRSTTIEGKSKFMTDGEDEPQNLLADPVDKFVRSLFRVSYTPSALR